MDKENKSVKRWFNKSNGEKRYKNRTEAVYSKYLDMFCNILGLTPDKLANVTGEEALKIQIKLAKVMKEKLNLREYSITQRINALHSFWRYNGVDLTENIIKYSGTPWLMREKAKHVK